MYSSDPGAVRSPELAGAGILHVRPHAPTRTSPVLPTCGDQGIRGVRRERKFISERAFSVTYIEE